MDACTDVCSMHTPEDESVDKSADATIEEAIRNNRMSYLFQLLAYGVIASMQLTMLPAFLDV